MAVNNRDMLRGQAKHDYQRRRHIPASVAMAHCYVVTVPAQTWLEGPLQRCSLQAKLPLRNLIAHADVICYGKEPPISMSVFIEVYCSSYSVLLVIISKSLRRTQDMWSVL